MSEIYVNTERRTKVIFLGEQGERNANTIVFDLSSWMNEYGPGGSAFVDIKRNGDQTAYTKQLTIAGKTARWKVDDIDSAVVGRGVVQLVYMMPGDSGESKTAVYDIVVEKSLDASGGDLPDPYESYIDEAREIRAGTTADAAAAAASADSARGYKTAAETAAGAAADAKRDAEEARDNAESSALDAEAWAVGQRGGEDVPALDETYQNNSKWYAEMAKQSASQKGFAHCYIDENGDLYMETVNLPYEFYLWNGDLYVREVGA